MLLKHIDYIQTQISDLQKEIDKLVEPYSEEFSALMTIHDVGRNANICILAEIENDMSEFKNSARLAK